MFNAVSGMLVWTSVSKRGSKYYMSVSDCLGCNKHNNIEYHRVKIKNVLRGTEGDFELIIQTVEALRKCVRKY